MDVYKHIYPNTLDGILKIKNIEGFTLVIFLNYRNFRDSIEKYHYPIYIPYHLESSPLIKFSHHISMSEAITILKIVINYKESVYMTNEMRKDILDFLQNLLEQEAQKRCIKHAANVIYKYWYDARSNPYNVLGKKRILKEFYNLLE